MRFSPLLDGDGVASSVSIRAGRSIFPFQSPSRWGRCCFLRTLWAIYKQVKFQSPSRWGRCCFFQLFCGRAGTLAVSVPFSMGTVLLRPIDPVVFDGIDVSVPFSMGTVLLLEKRVHRLGPFGRFSPLLDGDGVASQAVSAGADGLRCRFSPLLDGDGVASPAGNAAPGVPQLCFSPLLDGDGVASAHRVWRRGRGRQTFQSPSRWGRCCFSRNTIPPPRTPLVSVPFSMGTVLLPTRPASPWS